MFKVCWSFIIFEDKKIVSYYYFYHKYLGVNGRHLISDESFLKQFEQISKQNILLLQWIATVFIFKIQSGREKPTCYVYSTILSVTGKELGYSSAIFF